MKRRVERLAEAGFCAAAGLSALCILAILFFLIAGALPFFRSYGVLPFLFGTRWTPDRADLFGQAIAGSYGILPMLVGTLAASLGALAVGGIPGVWFAVFLFRFCPSRLREPAATAIRLLASIPSVVYGFFGLSVLLPTIARFVPTNGSGLLATSLILGTMILPTVASLSRTALEAVPVDRVGGAGAGRFPGYRDLHRGSARGTSTDPAGVGAGADARDGRDDGGDPGLGKRPDLSARTLSQLSGADGKRGA